MSPRLWPYTWLRHVAPGLVVALAALAAWCAGLVLLALAEPRLGAPLLLQPDQQAALVLGGVAAAVGGALVVVEGRLERTPRSLRAVEAALAAIASGLATTVGLLLLEVAVGLDDASLRWRERVLAWIVAGAAATTGPLATRLARAALERVQGAWDVRALPVPPALPGVAATIGLHLGTGAAAGAVASIVAYVAGLEAALDDRFLAFALGCAALGLVPGAVGQPVPDRLYRGWVRVLRGARPGRRIAIEPTSPVLAERFVGHFPSGVDLHLPPDDGVAELHASFLARDDGTYAARGLSVRRVRVRRLLAWVDLSWDPALPAPLETSLQDGDRLDLGDQAVVELVIAPREGTGS